VHAAIASMQIYRRIIFHHHIVALVHLWQNNEHTPLFFKKTLFSNIQVLASPLQGFWLLGAKHQNIIY
jgi:hypothetical protein